MQIDHIHFYVRDAQQTRQWFVDRLGFQPLHREANPHTQLEMICSGAIRFVLSSPRSPASPVAQFLRFHPPGVVDVALEVPHVERFTQRALNCGAKLLHPLRQARYESGQMQWSQIAAWGTLRHTLIQRSGRTPLLPPNRDTWAAQTVPVTPVLPPTPVPFTTIDHVVLNVAAGDLHRAATWYQCVLGFEPRQQFRIQTERSALSSQVMVHPDGCVQLPLNEPTSTNSQIQEFLDCNGGAGVQHIALHTPGILTAVAQLRQREVAFLSVPPAYYQQLSQQQHLPKALIRAIAAQEILVDWPDPYPQALLLQTFTQPIFDQPTFFFELIERQSYQAENQWRSVAGFGERNFRALFEAIEREQAQRGTL